MKEGWKIKTLGDLFDITSSKRVFESEWKLAGVPFYRAREIVILAKQGFVDNELFISEEMFTEYSAKYGIPKEGDIMVTGVGTLGVCYVVKEHDRFYFKDGNIIWLKKKSEVSSRFVEYAFRSDFLRKQIDNSIGATVGTYTIIKAKNTLIPLPPLPEQQRVVAILDEAFAAIATAKENAEKNLQNARAIFDSYLQSVFTQRGEGWVEKRLKAFCSFENGDRGTNYPSKSARTAAGIPFINAGHLTDYGIDFGTMNYISRERFDLLGAGKIRSGDILFCLRGSLGKFASVGELAEGAIASSLVIVRPDESVLKEFVLAYFRSHICAKMINHFKNGAAQPNLSADSLSKFLIPVPSLPVQQSIVSKLDGLSAETQRLESAYERKLAALDELKKSLLYQAFNGELSGE